MGIIMKEGWSEQEQRLQDERDAEEKARRNEPSMVKVQKSFKFDSMFGWLSKLINKMKKPKSLLLSLCFLCSCSINSASKIGPDGTKTSYYSGAVGGKGGAVHGDSSQDGLTMASFYDNEASFKHAIVGAVTYGIGAVVGSAVEAGYAAKTAQNAANQAAGVANTATAANVSNTATTANLIKDVGIKGEVPISAVGLPASP